MGICSFEDIDDDVPVIENLDERKGNTLREWVLSEPVDREIFRRFRNFLSTHTDDQGYNIHFERIKNMCQANGESLVVSYTDICTVQPILAIYVADAPTEILSIFDRAAKEVVLEHFPAYEQIRPEIHVRINDLPVV
jgi:DNA replication licensing factor MCM2